MDKVDGGGVNYGRDSKDQKEPGEMPIVWWPRKGSEFSGFHYIIEYT